MRKAILVGLFLVAAWMILPGQDARAHGGGTPQLVDGVVGQYRVFAWTQPEPLRVGEVHVTVSVTRPASAAASSASAASVVSDAQVDVLFQSQEDADVAFTVAANAQESLGTVYYEADAELPEAGEWHVTVQVAGPHGTGDVTFSDVVLPARTFNWTASGAAALGFLALIIGVRFWQSRSPKQTSASRRTNIQNV